MCAYVSVLSYVIRNFKQQYVYFTEMGVAKIHNHNVFNKIGYTVSEKSLRKVYTFCSFVKHS